MNTTEISWLAEILGITPDEAGDMDIDECVRRVHITNTQNPFDVTFVG